MTRQKLFSFLPPLHRFLPPPSRFQKNSFIVSFREKRLVLPIIQLRCFIRLFAHPSVETGRDREKGGKGDQVRPTHVWRGEVTFLGSAATTLLLLVRLQTPFLFFPLPPSQCVRPLSPQNVQAAARRQTNKCQWDEEGKEATFPFPFPSSAAALPHFLTRSKFSSPSLVPFVGPPPSGVMGRVSGQFKVGKGRREGGNFAKTPEEKGRKKEASPL